MSRDERSLEAGLTAGACRGRSRPARSSCSACCRTRRTTRSWRERPRPTESRCSPSTSRTEARVPLWDFPEGSLGRREVAAYLVAAALGWPNVPPTVLREGPEGTGSVQLVRAVRAARALLHPAGAVPRRVPRDRGVRPRREQRRPQGRALPARRGRPHLGDRPRRLLPRGAEAPHGDLGVHRRADPAGARRPPGRASARSWPRAIRRARSSPDCCSSAEVAALRATDRRRSWRTPSSRRPPATGRTRGHRSERPSMAGAAPRPRSTPIGDAHDRVLGRRGRGHDLRRRRSGNARSALERIAGSFGEGDAASEAVAGARGDRACDARTAGREAERYFGGRLTTFSVPPDLALVARGVRPPGARGRRDDPARRALDLRRRRRHGGQPASGASGRQRARRVSDRAVRAVPPGRARRAAAIGGYGRHEDRKRWLLRHEGAIAVSARADRSFDAGVREDGAMTRTTPARRWSCSRLFAAACTGDGGAEPDAASTEPTGDATRRSRRRWRAPTWPSTRPRRCRSASSPAPTTPGVQLLSFGEIDVAFSYLGADGGQAPRRRARRRPPRSCRRRATTRRRRRSDAHRAPPTSPASTSRPTSPSPRPASGARP